MENRNTVKELSIWAIISVWLMIMVVIASVIFSCGENDALGENGPDENGTDKTATVGSEVNVNSADMGNTSFRADGELAFSDEGNRNSDTEKIIDSKEDNTQPIENTDDSNKLKQKLILEKYTDESEIEYLSDDYCEYVRAKYDKIVVLDAGHGGYDGGTVIAGAGRAEKLYNLNILLKVEELFKKGSSPEEGTQNNKLKVIYTRTEDVYLELEERAEIANRLNADFFISIHCNSHDSKKRNGVEVLYYGGGAPPEADDKNTGEDGDDFEEDNQPAEENAGDSSEGDHPVGENAATVGEGNQSAEKDAGNVGEGNQSAEEDAGYLDEENQSAEEEQRRIRSEASEKLAQTVLSEALKAWDRPDFGVIPRNNLLVLYASKMPAVILEVGYLSNSGEAEMLEKEEIQDKVAEGIYNAILKASGAE